jgi:hypothetical protein
MMMMMIANAAQSAAGPDTEGNFEISQIFHFIHFRNNFEGQ